jgi:hypothetical protein
MVIVFSNVHICELYWELCTCVGLQGVHLRPIAFVWVYRVWLYVRSYILLCGVVFVRLHWIDGKSQVIALP